LLGFSPSGNVFFDAQATKSAFLPKNQPLPKESVPYPKSHLIRGSALKGHDFSRADKANENCWALAPEGTLFLDAQATNRRSYPKISLLPKESLPYPKSHLIRGSALRGHDFSRAAKANENCWALAPEGTLFDLARAKRIP
jgi:hypothetical protein